MATKLPYKLIHEGTPRTGLTQGIIYNGWTIKSKKAPICNSSEMDSIQKELGIPPPEMVFGKNHVTLNSPNNVQVTLRALDALRLVDTSSDSSEHIKVAYAEEWTRKSAANNSDVKDVVKPYDWTYSTDYKGTVLSDQQFEEADEPVIDVERLKKQEPILFYDENILYEDELADNGTTVLSVRLRVMPSCFLVLQRLFLRVDDVLIRINDTRIYHEFGTPYLIREYTSREDHFRNLSSKLPSAKSDLSLLNDSNWVATVLPQKPVCFKRERLHV